MKIRVAVPQDASQIARIVETSFAEQVSVDRVASLVLSTTRSTYVAEADGEVCGFIDGFHTASIGGMQRLELDLLAVMPAHAGKGIGSKLVQRLLEQDTAIFSHCRALVAADNVPMQRLCQRMGFYQSERHSLFICTEGKVMDDVETSAHLIRVRTLTYDGIWLEGQITPNTIAHARSVLAVQRSEVLGAVLPSGSDAATFLAAANFEHVKDFHWWRKEAYEA